MGFSNGKTASMQTLSAQRAECREQGAGLTPVAVCRSAARPSCSSSSIQTCLGISNPPACCGQGGRGWGGGGREGSVPWSMLTLCLCLSPGAEDVRGQADAAAAPGFPGLRAGLGRRLRHSGDPLRRGAGGHAAVRLRGQGLLLQ